MFSTLGQGFVLIALLCCTIGAPVGFAAGRTRSLRGTEWARRLTLGFFLSMLAANLLMVVALLRHDFSVSYVAQVGSTKTPAHITIVSLWSALEGSILLWGLILGAFVWLFAVLQKEGHDDYLAYALGTALAVGIFFCFLIAGPANPFRAVPPPVPTEGPGPNPLLQNHLLMIVHPPTLYLGYVGMTIPFAMAVSALLRGHLGPTWLLPLRNWLLVSVGFLSLGIMLGGWWAYEVLGWGGYWAWDPVENASFLPWLTGIAAVHSAIVQQRRGTLKAWTVVLVLVSFLLTILGTFLTRSGVVNSVHSFTQTPIGPIFLGFLGLVSLAVLVLLALRIDTLSGTGRGSGLASRESAFLLNNLVLVSITFTVLVGTLYPVAAEALRGVKVSVGEPFFNRFSVPLFLVLTLLMGVGPALPWGTGDRRLVRRALLRPLPGALIGVALVFLIGARSAPALIAGGLFGYALVVTTDQALRPTRQRRAKGDSLGRAALESTRRVPRWLGGYVVHLGVLVTFLAIAISSTQQTTMEAAMRPGDTATIGRYTLEYVKGETRPEPHVTKQAAVLSLAHGGDDAGLIEPTLNFYDTRREPLSTPAVRTTLSHDLYVTLMNTSRDGSIGIRAYVTPAVVWVWIGVFMMVAGTVLCLLPGRRAATP